MATVFSRYRERICWYAVEVPPYYTGGMTADYENIQASANHTAEAFLYFYWKKHRRIPILLFERIEIMPSKNKTIDLSELLASPEEMSPVTYQYYKNQRAFSHYRLHSPRQNLSKWQ